MNGFDAAVLLTEIDLILLQKMYYWQKIQA